MDFTIEGTEVIQKLIAKLNDVQYTNTILEIQVEKLKEMNAQLNEQLFELSKTEKPSK